MYSKARASTLLIVALMLVATLGSYDSSDPSFNLSVAGNATNLLGNFGSYVADIFYQILGITSFILVIVFTSWSFLIYKNGFLRWKIVKFISLILAIIFASIALGEVKINFLPAGGGGALGILLLQVARKFLIDFQNLIIPLSILLSLFFLFFAIGIGIGFYLALPLLIKNLIVMISVRKTRKIPPLNIEQTHQIYSSENTNLKAAHIQDLLIRCRNSIAYLRQKILQLLSFKPKEAEIKLFREPIIGSSDIGNSAGNLVQTDSVADEHSHKQYSVQSVQNQAKAKAVYYSRIDDKGHEHENVLPSTDLLDEADKNKFQAATPAELEQKAEELLTVLGDFGVRGKIIDIKQGPVVTMYEFEPAAGTKSSRVIGLSDDIARSLSAHSTRIAVIPGRNALGIELPNKQRMFFRLKELIETKEFRDTNILLPIILGKDLSGQPLIADLAKMPHLLVAGTTGSGKSVAINAMIMSLLYKYTPAQCRMIMIDPKMLELSAYDNIPHLMTPVVTEPGKAVVALKWAVKEMENRYRLMSHLGVRNIANFNAKILDAMASGKLLERRIQTGFDPETGKPVFESIPIDMVKMPFIVVIVDEMADLMLVAGKDIESSIQRLAQMARAAGIHIIMATQRPSVDVITGVIKANFPSRVSFKVTSKIDSRTILGEQGAEQLLGMGDMLYMGGSARIARVHGPFVDDKEVERVTNFLKTTGEPEYVSAVTESEDADFSGNDLMNEEGDDEIYKQALNIVRTERKSSISYIQRALRIGYNRAANLVEEMEKNGVLSAPNHSGKREVLLPEN